MLIGFIYSVLSHFKPSQHFHILGFAFSNKFMNLNINYYVQRVHSSRIDFNLLIIQSEDAQIVNLHGDMVALLRKFMLFLLPANEIKPHTADLSKVPFQKRKIQLANVELNIGNDTRVYLLKHEEDFEDSATSSFFWYRWVDLCSLNIWSHFIKYQEKIIS